MLIREIFVGSRHPADQFEFPMSWKQSIQPGDENRGESTIDLHGDGTGIVARVLFGDEVRINGGLSCAGGEKDSYSGRVTWSISADNSLELEQNNGSAVFVPDACKFAGVDWHDMRELFCDGSMLYYSSNAGADH
ncbi:hypothetical protein BKA02_001569 [Microbacterium pseudoresistens]|uniref:Uncharacterized protein n=1 Tax=Microbacterium pseudoresistens TaxID=640634 RepID=A0A7Y9EVC6_9MICO|nr:hypothetical protein [Microbacterium pseudoresistens]